MLFYFSCYVAMMVFLVELCSLIMIKGSNENHFPQVCLGQNAPPEYYDSGINHDACARMSFNLSAGTFEEEMTNFTS